MQSPFNFRSVVFKRAYRIVRETGCTMSVALVEAWKRYREYRDKVTKELATRINHFDVYYYMSDDNRTYMYWSNVQNSIRREIKSFPRSFASAITMQLSDQEFIKSFI